MAVVGFAQNRHGLIVVIDGKQTLIQQREHGAVGQIRGVEGGGGAVGVVGKAQLLLGDAGALGFVRFVAGQTVAGGNIGLFGIGAAACQQKDAKHQANQTFHPFPSLQTMMAP